MSSVERTHQVLQPFQANRANPDRRRGKGNSHPFELEFADAIVEPGSRVETTPACPLPDGGNEGVGEHVNIVV